MKQDTIKTDVIFRIDNQTKDVFALFPYQIESRFFIGYYQHVGQHSSADYNFCIMKSKPAKPEQYESLKIELEDYGYSLNVIERQSRVKYLEAYKESRKQFA